MSVLESYHRKFSESSVCVVIPTFNNAGSLAKVIRDVSDFTPNIIVVNDGSTDETLAVLHGCSVLKLITGDKNQGKGRALRQAFIAAKELGFHYAISIDSDGQHDAGDLPKFIEKLEQEKNAIIIGCRNMNQQGIPGKSSFGNRFSNFWFWVETGIRMQDTQSGYRLYPLEALSEIRFFTSKYEFEIEVLVRAAWKGIRIDSVPVSVYYAPLAERVSHFRPFRDFFRISVLNTILVILAFAWIKPRNFFRNAFQGQKIRQVIREQFYNPEESDQLKAMSVAFGVFMGIIPVWGFQLMLAIFLAILFRLNKPLVIIAANISITPMIPLIIFLSYRMGALCMGSQAVQLDFSRDITLATVRDHWLQYVYGSFTLAIFTAFIFGTVFFVILKFIKRKARLAG